jgi:hypothetical protein
VTIHGDLEFYGVNGKKLPGYGGGSSENIIQSTIEAEPGELKEVRFRYFPATHRVLVTIPELPGLPEENRNIENLFDVHIPYFRNQYEYAFQGGVAQLLQIQNTYIPLTFPQGYFPLIHTNTTPRALFNEIRSLRSNPAQQLVADPRKNIIELRSSPIEELKKKIKRELGM